MCDVWVRVCVCVCIEFDSRQHSQSARLSTCCHTALAIHSLAALIRLLCEGGRRFCHMRCEHKIHCQIFNGFFFCRLSCANSVETCADCSELIYPNQLQRKLFHPINCCSHIQIVQFRWKSNAIIARAKFKTSFTAHQPQNNRASNGGSWSTLKIRFKTIWKFSEWYGNACRILIWSKTNRSPRDYLFFYFHFVDFRLSNQPPAIERKELSKKCEFNYGNQHHPISKVARFA